MGQGHHIIDMRVTGQQLVLDTLDRMVQHAGHTLHGGGDAEDIARPDRAIGVAITLEGEALKWHLRCGNIGGQWQAIERRCGGHAQLVLIDPTAPRNGLQGIADHLTVADHLATFGNSRQRDLVALGDKIHRHQPVGKHSTRRYALVVDHHRDIIPRVQADRAR